MWIFFEYENDIFFHETDYGYHKKDCSYFYDVPSANENIWFGTVYTNINSEIDQIHTTVSAFVYLLLAALHVSTPFLGHPQAYINTDISCWINKYLSVCISNRTQYTILRKMPLWYIQGSSQIYYDLTKEQYLCSPWRCKPLGFFETFVRV
jgi:hypothetical protein